MSEVHSSAYLDTRNQDLMNFQGLHCQLRRPISFSGPEQLKGWSNYTVFATLMKSLILKNPPLSFAPVPPFSIPHYSNIYVDPRIVGDSWEEAEQNGDPLSIALDLSDSPRPISPVSIETTKAEDVTQPTYQDVLPSSRFLETSPRKHSTYFSLTPPEKIINTMNLQNRYNFVHPNRLTLVPIINPLRIIVH